MRKVLSKKEQEAYLLSKIEEPVTFTYPEGPPLRGKLSDRSVTFDREDDSVVYWNVMDRIRFEGEDEDWMRITYYRYKKKEGKWIFAGQTSISDPISDFGKLFINAIKEKEWIRPLFRKICKELCKHPRLQK